jgi:hypothetical protein
MNKYGTVEIHDASRKIDGVKVKAYRVKIVGANGEKMQISEVLNEIKAVKTHINALLKIFASEGTVTIVDRTKEGKFNKLATSNG